MPPTSALAGNLTPRRSYTGTASGPLPAFPGFTENVAPVLEPAELDLFVPF